MDTAAPDENFSVETEMTRVAQNTIVLKKSRGNLAFALGLLLAAILAYGVENRGKVLFFGLQSNVVIKTSPLQLQIAKHGPLGDRDIQAGKIAWQYFVNNTQPETGLVNAVDGFPSTTMWDQASYLLGMISAYRLDIIGKDEFDTRLSGALNSLDRLPLFEGMLPNKVYNTITLSKTNYANEAVDRGVGWSALDITRMIIPLDIIINSYPAHTSAARAILGKWQIHLVTANGELQGARVDLESNQTEYVQEGRLGYEEYGARAALLLALDSLVAARVDLNIRKTKIYDTEIVSDRRDARGFGANNYVVSEPYILMALELGFDRESAELAFRVLKVQEQRFLATGVLTAVSEDHVDQDPFFLYNSILVNGKKWVAVSETGEIFNDLKTLSTKAAFGWDMIYHTEYTALLKEAAWKAKSDQFGWYSGVYEKDGRINASGTANTNGVILEALHFRVFGPLFHQ